MARAFDCNLINVQRGVGNVLDSRCLQYNVEEREMYLPCVALPPLDEFKSRNNANATTQHLSASCGICQA